MNYSNMSNASSSNQFTPDALKKIEETIIEFEREKARHREEMGARLTEWMRMNGADPVTHILIAPSKRHGDLPGWCWPDFVRFSPLVDNFILVERAALQV